MKRIYKNNDIQFNITVNNLPVNSTLINSITFYFYTLNRNNSITKTRNDVDGNNVITIPWNELSKLEEGVMYYDYHLAVKDENQLDGTIDTVEHQLTNYYICSGNNNIDVTGGTVTTNAEWGKIEGTITNQADLVSYIDLKIKEVNAGGSGNVDLSEYAKKTEIPTKTSQLTNDSNYLTEHQDISGKVDKTELTNYVTNESLNSKGYITEIPSEYVTDLELSGKGYLVNSDIENKADKSEIPSLVGYAKETWVNEQIDSKITAGTDIDLSSYAKKEDLNSKVDTSAYTADKATFALKSEIPSDYLTAKDIENKADRSEIPSLDGYLKEIPAEYITETELNQKGYLSSVPANYVTDEKLNQKGYLTEHQSLIDYALKSELPTKTSELTNDSNFITSIPSEYVTETELNSKAYLTAKDIVNKADKSEIPSLVGYAKETWVNQQIDAKITAGTDVDLSSYAKKTDLNKKLDTSVYDNDKLNYVTDSELASKGYVTDIQLALKADKSDIPSLANYVTNDSLDAKGYLTEIPREYVTEYEMLQKDYVSNADLDKKQYVNRTLFNNTLENYLQKQVAEATYATKAELDNAIGGVNTRINEIKNMI